MTILNDIQLREEVEESNGKFISPFLPNLVTGGVLSYGLSSFGYDCRLDKEFKLQRNDLDRTSTILDVKKNPTQNFYNQTWEDNFVILPGEYVLGQTMEEFSMPEDVLAICLGKSTYARAGIVLNTTPAEPGWRGHLTLEIFNAGKFPVKLYVGEGICQMIFFRGSPPHESYSSRSGKYQDQKTVTGPIVR